MEIMDETKEEKPIKLTRLYDTEEELKQIKVLSMVIKKNDVKRISDVALGVLQINSDNLVANTAYNLDIKLVTAISDIPFYTFNCEAIQNFLTKILNSNANFDGESTRILAETIFGFVSLLAQSIDENLSSLDLILQTAEVLNLGDNSTAGFYKIAVNAYCNEFIITTLKNHSSDDGVPYDTDTFYANEILKARRSCLMLLKQKIATKLDGDAQKPLTVQIDGTGLTNTAPAQPVVENPQIQAHNRRIIYLLIGVGAFFAIIVFLLMIL